MSKPKKIKKAKKSNTKASSDVRENMISFNWHMYEGIENENLLLLNQSKENIY